MAARSVRSALFLIVVLCVVNAQAARADGLPVVGFSDGRQIVGTPGSNVIYGARVTRRGTIVSVQSRAHRLLRAARLAGRFVVPVVAIDGSTAGLSADGRTLVLTWPRTAFLQRTTRLAIIDARILKVRRLILLRGDFGFDAISPDGAWIYLIQYVSQSDPGRYRVRALSTGTGQLLGREIIDPHDRGEKMAGTPIARVSSPDGRWAYTLYGGGGDPFVHALDTAHLRARCIDLPGFAAGTDIFSARLTLIASRWRLVVHLGHRTLATLNTRSLSVLPARRAAPATLRTATRRASAGRVRTGTIGIAFPIFGGFLLMIVTILALRRRVVAGPRRIGAP